MDQQAIDTLTERFFEVFTNTGGKPPNVQDIKNLFIPQGIIINNTAETPAIYDLDSFIKPREEMLTDGTLTDFRERETSHTTEIFKKIAQRFCRYEKSGVLNGQYFEATGMKTIQFIKVNEEWKMASVVWCD